MAWLSRLLGRSSGTAPTECLLAEALAASNELSRARAGGAGELAPGFRQEALARTRPLQRQEAERHAMEAMS